MEKVKIKVWVVSGERSSTMCLSEERANRINSSLGGWGTIKEEVREAYLAEEGNNGET